MEHIIEVKSDGAATSSGLCSYHMSVSLTVVKRGGSTSDVQDLYHYYWSETGIVD